VPEIEVAFVRGQPRVFYTDLPHGLIYNLGPPEILFLPAEVARRLPDLVSRSLADMQLVTIPVAKLVELVERASGWFSSRMQDEPAEMIERAFSEHCYLAVIPGQINLVLRNPRETDMAEAVKVKLQVDHVVVDGRRVRFGSGKGVD
jgi:hypothetical protein